VDALAHPVAAVLLLVGLVVAIWQALPGSNAKHVTQFQTPGRSCRPRAGRGRSEKTDATVAGTVDEKKGDGDKKDEPKKDATVPEQPKKTEEPAGCRRREANPERREIAVMSCRATPRPASSYSTPVT